MTTATKKRKLWVMQDGGDFYLYNEDPTADEVIDRQDALKPLEIVSAPQKVKDFDLEAAVKARRWFLDYCDTNNIEPIWTS